ncbi:efflux RND transporter periplasmic adaptor subunit [Aquiflexum gelatinilyticum]|uniref:Efflux RND transporter periplasmic adaptor subunit n=1 Tax=Aquiflexum gelatinilyticum TaxID=2961943 RepID=A0A9X2PBP5_9BACT|nr:efflux RND transporter periplasmic adaptor subunit [Aquiflexum gelatinilyticum]MCR9015775.1 efflux RND transporter periplasmic adaptor subunit [Aquiflexum gelatinilyticum]
MRFNATYLRFLQKPTLYFVTIGLVMGCTKKEEIILPPVKVNVVKAIQKDVPIFEEYVAQVFGESDVDIRARVEGWVTSVNFKEGSFVKKGDLLYIIDDIQYKNRVDQVRSQLTATQTEMVRAEGELSRVKPLADMNALSKQDLDNAKAKYEASLAQVRAAEASLENAKVEYGYTRVYAPFDGLVGISNFRVGDYVTRSGTTSVLTTISSIGAVRVRFQISEREYLRLTQMTTGELETAKKNIQLIMADGSLYSETGEVDFADREVDPKTGTLTIEARFPNPKGILRPGLFVKSRVLIKTFPGAIMVPQRAVMQLQHISRVFVVTDSSTVKAVPVETGPKSGDGWIITKGINAGDRIAIIGSASLTPDAKIEAVEQKWPENSPNQ